MLRYSWSLVFVGLLLSSPALAKKEKWEADPAHSRIGFSIRHLMISNVNGDFKDYIVKVLADTEDITKSHVDVTIQVKSINTNIMKRDEHLRGPDFFDAAKYPTIRFRSKKILKEANDKLVVVGDLTMHGVTKEVKLQATGALIPIKDPWGGKRVGLQVTTKINRQDFGLKWNQTLESGGIMLGNEVSIIIELELIPSK